MGDNVTFQAFNKQLPTDLPQTYNLMFFNTAHVPGTLQTPSSCHSLHRPNNFVKWVLFPSSRHRLRTEAAGACVSCLSKCWGWDGDQAGGRACVPTHPVPLPRPLGVFPCSPPGGWADTLMEEPPGPSSSSASARRSDGQSDVRGISSGFLRAHESCQGFNGYNGNLESCL